MSTRYFVDGLAFGSQYIELSADDAAQWEADGPVLTDQDPAVSAWLLDAVRKNSNRRTIGFAHTLRERIASSKHYLQAARWSVQLASAQAIKAGAATAFDTSTLGREARLRGLGETGEQLADKVIANSLVFASVGAAVDGIERHTLDQIAACTDVAGFEPILIAAKATAHAEFLDIFTAVYSAEQATAMAEQFFGAGS